MNTHTATDPTPGKLPPQARMARAIAGKAWITMLFVTGETPVIFLLFGATGGHTPRAAAGTAADA